MKDVLVVVDYQKDFVNGSLGFKKAESLEDGIYNKVKEYLSKGNKVIFTYDTHKENYLETREGKSLPVPHCYLGTEGHELYGKLNEFVNVENTIHINKGAFGIAPEDMIKLKETLGDVENIEILGVVTNICVISNAVTFQTSFPNANIKVIGSLCASFDDNMHNEALNVMESFQIKVER